MPKKHADPCEYCPGRLRPGRVTVDLRRKNTLVVVRDVPAEVCDRCGAKYYSADVVGRLDEIFGRRLKVRRKLQVPVVEFGPVA